MGDVEQRKASAAARWQAALHAVQTGVKLSMQRIQRAEHDTSPKHLRVGVNAAMCDHAGLARLLIEKGVIAEVEYLEAIAAEMEAEQARYEEKLGVSLG